MKNKEIAIPFYGLNAGNKEKDLDAIYECVKAIRELQEKFQPIEYHNLRNAKDKEHGAQLRKERNEQMQKMEEMREYLIKLYVGIQGR